MAVAQPNYVKKEDPLGINYNSSYNFSSSTLRIMSKEFQRGSEICEAMKSNKADWDTLFETFPFLKAYNNYLQIAISAKNADDSRNWKVIHDHAIHIYVYRLRGTLTTCFSVTPTLVIFQTNPNLFIVATLWVCKENKEFLRMKAVNVYTLWKPGMEIRVCHVKKKNIPDFVFPGGVCPPRPSKLARALELKASSGRKGKRPDDDVENKTSVNSVAPFGGDVLDTSSPTSTANIPSQNGNRNSEVSSSSSLPTKTSLETVAHASSSIVAEKMDIEKVMLGSYA
ncbi:nuclear poly(A) polymerase 1-like [Humulus lupulus]|uniref:nuclear poly(A) polymerase 1-like n=1 Tax=Humulus lupulus TaxID=3486 RepID=UPI002B411212|nr:nuclear poly(A) polymerase 1-like [Humulus lupulus]